MSDKKKEGERKNSKKEQRNGTQKNRVHTVLWLLQCVVQPTFSFLAYTVVLWID